MGYSKFTYFQLVITEKLKDKFESDNEDVLYFLKNICVLRSCEYICQWKSRWSKDYNMYL